MLPSLLAGWRTEHRLPSGCASRQLRMVWRAYHEEEQMQPMLLTRVPRSERAPVNDCTSSRASKHLEILRAFDSLWTYVLFEHRRRKKRCCTY